MFLILFLCSCITETIFCADPYANIRTELSETTPLGLIESLIKEDEKARNTAVMLQRLEPSIAQPTPYTPLSKPMTPEEHKAFQTKMAERARHARFGNLGK